MKNALKRTLVLTACGMMLFSLVPSAEAHIPGIKSQPPSGCNGPLDCTYAEVQGWITTAAVIANHCIDHFRFDPIAGAVTCGVATPEILE